MSGQQEMYNHARDFREKVSNCIDSSEEVMNFYQALKLYNNERNMTKLVNDLMAIINTPKRHILFDEVGSLIDGDNYEEFISKVPVPPSEGIRIVKIRRVATEALGFGIRGGKEHEVGVYITSVLRGSRADIAGLKVGDEILLVNGFLISESTHGEVVGLMRTRRNLRLKVRSTRKYPERINGNLSWKTLIATKENVFRYHPDVLNHLVSQLALVRSQSPVLHIRETDKHVKFIVGPMGLGCSVRNGIPTKYGIFIIHVTPGSLAERVGITVGDQIIALNKKNFANIKYAEAVQLLKATKEFDMILRPCREAREFVEFSRSKGYAIVSASNPPSPVKKMQSSADEHVQVKPETVRPVLVPVPVPVIVDTHEPSEPVYSKVKRTSRKRSSSKRRQVETSESSSEEIAQNLTFSDKMLGGREPKSVNVEKRDLLIWVLEELDGRILVKFTGGADNANSGVKSGDQVLCAGDISLVGLTLRQAQSVVDDLCKRDDDTIVLVIGCLPVAADSPGSAVVSSNWSFAQKDLSSVNDKDLVFDTKF